jgi:Na+/melibiose symporter-like transporter
MTAAAAPRRSNAVLAAFSGPCLPLAAFGVALPVTLPEFYATYVGLELGVVATVFMAVRLIDIVFDPFLGWGMDKTRTRFGRYRPWMALATPMLMLAALMMFVLVQPGAPAVYLFGWLLFLYLGFSIGTLGQLGWAAVLAPQYDQRSRVYGWWQVFNIIGVVLILVLPTVVVQTGIGTYADGVRIMVWGIIIALPPILLIIVSFGLILIAMVSGMLSLGILKNSQPADLLR